MRLLELGQFVRKIYLRKRFGHLTPLRILRVEIKSTFAECDWLARSRCAWDADRLASERGHDASLRTLEDALAIREFLFCEFPEVQSATLRVYRRNSDDQLEMVIGGTVHRNDRAGRRIRSAAMKGKLYGLHFRMTEGGLEALQAEDWLGATTADFLRKLETLPNGGSLNGT
jgi:hypothetical protein